jgi:cation-transporting ATPase F
MESLFSSHWHHLPGAEVVELLDTHAEQGLDRFEIEQRRKHFGPNMLPSRKGRGPLVRFLLQFHQPLVYILVAAGVVTLLLHDWIDAGVILAVVLVNAMIGYLQESKAVAALEALARTMTTQANVIRSGSTRSVPSQELVPGDLVVLQSGDKVPADVRLLRIRDLHADESALTGESVPVQKRIERLEPETPLAERCNMAYTSSLITYGQAAGIVVATGGNTEVGRISKLIASAEVLQTPLTRKIERFSGILLYVILGLAGAAFVVGMARGQGVVDMLMAAIALAVGAIPEGLPAAVTITLAIGVSRMAKRHAIVRKLPVVETLGSTTVICSDKTGTLTENQMTVREVWAGGRMYHVSGSGYSPKGELRADAKLVQARTASEALIECLTCGVLCNDSALELDDGRWKVRGDPTEGALLAVGSKLGLDVESLRSEWTRKDSIPFESEHQYMATLNERSDGKRYVYVKGAAEKILERCDRMLDAHGGEAAIGAAAVTAEVERMAKQGLRVLAMAGGEAPSGRTPLDHQSLGSRLVLLGLQGMIDPPRQEAIRAVDACKKAGIRVKMITGDHALTAAAIADLLGISTCPGVGPARQRVITGRELEECSDEELIERADRACVFARVSPEQKLRLVRALQARGHVTAMTGDGVNDAPALKQSDIGIAMGRAGTEVAKEASDMILTDDNFATIEAAVEEGRGVYDNLTKFIVWTLPTNLGEGLVILAAILVGAALPILPIQILWINMTTAVLLGMTLAFEPKEPDIMSRPPRDPATPILTGALVGRILIVGALLLGGAFGLFEWALLRGAGEPAARTIAVNVFVFTELVYLFNCRSLKQSILQVGLFSNRWVWIGACAMTVLQILFTYNPIFNRVFGSAPVGWAHWSAIAAVAVAAGAVVWGEERIRRLFHRDAKVAR